MLRRCACILVCWSTLLCGGAGAADFDAGRRLLLAAEPLQGGRLEPEVLTGRVVIVTFFASWCPPCRAEFAALNEMAGRYGPARLTIVAVNAFEAWGGKKDPARMARFLRDTAPRFALVEATREILQTFGSVTRIPTLIVYDGQGRETWRFVHEVDAVKMSAGVDDLAPVLDRLIGASD